jgi:diguanylate cyclase (GGDEF)-like protein
MTPPCIQVVEDESLIAADIRDVLLAFGYVVPPAAATKSEALRAVSQFRPDLILMDVRLRGGDDGVEAAAAIRETWPAPVVFLSSYADDATLARAQSVEPFGYLLKPFNDYELRATVQMVLRRSMREESLAHQTKLLAAVVNGAQDGMVAINQAGDILFANEAAQRAGAGPDAANRSAWTTGSGVRLADQATPCPPERLPLVRALQGENVCDVELFFEPYAGSSGCFYSMNAAPLRDEAGRVVGAVATARGLAGRRSTMSDLHHLSATDDLTGALNRRGFMEAAGAQLLAGAEAGRKPAVFFIDLNGLKQINDTMGHAEGDRALVDTFTLLRSAFRTSDVVARLGGDEFVVLVADAEAISSELRHRLEAAVDDFNAICGREYRLSMSVGIAEYDPTHHSSLRSLLDEADKRMYEAKAVRNDRRAEVRAGRTPGPPAR